MRIFLLEGNAREPSGSQYRHGLAFPPSEMEPVSQPFTFELCAETLDACRVARAGGAHRLELCTDLRVGGLTPALDLVQAAVRTSGLPVHVLLRPSADSFGYSPEVYAAIAHSMGEAKAAGAAGFVLGLLQPDGSIDRERTRALVELAAPLPVTFHRAFDATPDLYAALEDAISIGCARVLTSGGAEDVLAGASTLARLVEQAGSRIEVAVGGGLTLCNAAEVARRTGSRHFHASLRAHAADGAPRSLQGRIEAMLAILAERLDRAEAPERAGISERVQNARPVATLELEPR